MTNDDKRNKIKKIQIRLTEYDKNRIQMLADRYAGGNLSLWMIEAGLNAPRKFLQQNSVKK